MLSFSLIVRLSVSISVRLATALVLAFPNIGGIRIVLTQSVIALALGSNEPIVPNQFCDQSAPGIGTSKPYSAPPYLVRKLTEVHWLLVMLSQNLCNAIANLLVIRVSENWLCIRRIFDG